MNIPPWITRITGEFINEISWGVAFSYAPAAIVLIIFLRAGFIREFSRIVKNPCYLIISVIGGSIPLAYLWISNPDEHCKNIKLLITGKDARLWGYPLKNYLEWYSQVFEPLIGWTASAMLASILVLWMYDRAKTPAQLDRDQDPDPPAEPPPERTRRTPTLDRAGWGNDSETPPPDSDSADPTA